MPSFLKVKEGIKKKVLLVSPAARMSSALFFYKSLECLGTFFLLRTLGRQKKSGRFLFFKSEAALPFSFLLFIFLKVALFFYKSEALKKKKAQRAAAFIKKKK
jgi:hypothetical protein